MIGATDFLVRFPFLVEGIVIGLVGATIPLIALYVMYDKIMIYVLEQFSFVGELFEFVAPAILFKSLVPVGLALGVGIGLLGSSWTIRKHLRV